MSLIFFQGPAGSGKTTRLMSELTKLLKVHPLNDYQKVLALTKIHGSRRRLHHRLAAIPELAQRFDCMTADSFARQLLSRWRSMVQCRFGDVPNAGDHNEFCIRAATLLAEESVNRWVIRTYPIIILDELQDSKKGQLKMFQELTTFATCLAAGDDFQDLDADEKNEPVSWACQNAHVISLEQIHRTDVAGLLKAASAIRDSQELKNGKGFKIVGVEASQLGAWQVSINICNWRKHGSIAIITPTGPGRAPFVRDSIRRVETAPFQKPFEFGPYKVPWELSYQDALGQFVDNLNLPNDPNEKIRADEIELGVTSGLSSRLVAWLERQRKILARTEFTVAEIHNQIALIQQRIRAFRYSQDRQVCAMTVHQAKNREFTSVIVLWPFQIQGSVARQRRLLYNAITRAKQRAVVIVQDPQKVRITRPPFVPVS